jgi:hypothetical protein
MENSAEKNLMQLKGVGQATARRLVAAGLDDYAKLAASGEEALRAVRGLNPRSIPLILEQAAALAGDAEKAVDPALARVERVRTALDGLRMELGRLVAAHPAKGKKLVPLTKESDKLTALITAIESALPARAKRAGKALNKAGRKLAKLSGSDPKKTAKGLKKTRKRLKKALA